MKDLVRLPDRLSARAFVLLLARLVSLSLPLLAAIAASGQTVQTLTAANAATTNIVVNGPAPAAKHKPKHPNVAEQINNGNAFLDANLPDKAIEVCAAALKAIPDAKSGEDKNRQNATDCLTNAEQLRLDLAAVDMQLKRLDKAIQAHDPVGASHEIETLTDWYGGKGCAEDDKGHKDPDCVARFAKFKTYMDEAIAARGPLCQNGGGGSKRKQQTQPESFWGKARRWLGRFVSGLDSLFRWLGSFFSSLLTELCALPPTPSKLPGYLLGLLEVLGYLVALVLASWFAGTGLLRFVLPKKPVFSDLWYVWSIEDKTGAGAAGAIMEALDVRANPLIAPFIQEDKIERKVARSRRHLLLAPPFHDEHFAGNQEPNHALRNLVWKDYLDSGPETLLFIEEIPFDLEPNGGGLFLPRFELAEYYEEVDASVGGLQVKGIMALLRNFNRWKRRNCPGVIGVVNSSAADGRTTWTVRLNGDNRHRIGWIERLFLRLRCRKIPVFDDKRLVASVFADSVATEFGDTLGTVAQRAALKLVTRIADHDRQLVSKRKGKRLNNRPYDTDQIHAIALFRQGIDTLMQCL